ncbi:MAG: S8 family serine peptidase [Calditrichaeota bacterium]|nr:S8 family serine peptidase [Calditrichota bacterium]
MSTKKTTITVSIIMFVVLLNFVVSGQSKTSGSLPFPGARIVRDSTTLITVEKSIHSRLETTLSTFLDIYSESGSQSTIEFARRHHITLKEDRILVELILNGNRSVKEITESMLKKCNAVVDRRSKHFILLWVPIEQLENIAESIGFISLIHRPFEPIEDIVSEGVESIGAEKFHDNDILGQGVKIAVIDIGFAILEDAQDSGELPQELTVRNYSGEPIDEGSSHGVGCAEIVYDLAPEAEIYLLKIQYSSDFENAVNYSSEEGIHIISRSLGQWVPSGDYYRGEDMYSEIVNDVYQDGIFFVNSAGNYARRHYRAEFDDQDERDNYHRFDDGVSVNHFIAVDGEYLYIEQDSRIQAALVWDDFPETDQNYDLFLVHWNDNEEWEVADESSYPQNGGAPPWEYLSYYVQEEGYYGIMVQNNGGDDGIDFTIQTRSDLAFHVTEGSIGVPAIAEGAFAVGSIADSVWYSDDIEIENYSSQGPTYDGRRKPELCGPTAVSTLAYGELPFRGTSASCPHAAGAAALLLSQDNDRTNEDLRDLLLAYAVDVGDEGPDNVYGFGKLNLIMGRMISVPDDFETIQAAIDAAEDGDTVLVSPGTYVENINFEGKDITVGSLYLTIGLRSYADSTIISGEESDTEGIIRITDTSKVVLTGFTLTNGYGFYDNFDMSYGSGIMIRNSEVQIENCIFRNNGPGIGQWFSNIVFCDQSSVSIRRCIANNNTSNSFLCIVQSDVSISNSTLALNTIDEGFFLYGMGNLIVVNSILWNCDTLEVVKRFPHIFYSCIKGGYEGEGNFDSDPEFTDPDNGDLALSEDSPCIDAGIAFFVWEDDTLVNMSEDEYHGEAPDIGAYESDFSVVDMHNVGIPTEFKLYQNYPNPFNSTTTITYSLPVASSVSLQLYDIAGRNIKTLVEGNKLAGVHRTLLEAGDLPSGLYFVRLEISEQTISSKIMLMK